MTPWSTVALGDLVELRSGGTPAKSRPELWAGNLPWVSPKDVKVERLHDTEEHLSEAAVGNGTRAVDAGTILLVVRSMILAREVPLTVVTRRSAFNQDIKAVLPRPGLDAGFLWAWLLASRETILGVVDEAGHGTKRIQTDRLLELPVCLPPPRVQRRIASILGAYDDLIEVNRRRIAVLEEMARRLFEEWFVHFRFPDREGIQASSRELPSGWTSGHLGDLLELVYGKALKATDRSTGVVPVIGSSGVIGFHDEALVERPGIVLGRKGNVGAVVWSPVPFFPIDTVFYVESDYPASYLLQQLRRMPFQSSDAAVPGLNRSAALKLPVAIPPFDLVLRFDATISPTMRLVESLQAAQVRLAESRDLLLPRLISGDLPVAAAERELEVVA